MAITEKQVKDDLNLIETLKQQIQELQKQKAEVVKDINRPIYEAKEKADKIIADAKAKAQEIEADANNKKAVGEEVTAKKKRELDVLTGAAQRRNDEALALKAQIERDKADFNAYKYALETNLAQQKSAADKMLAEATELRRHLDGWEQNIKTRESVIIRRESDYQSALVTLEQKKLEAQAKIDELATKEKSLADTKIEISALKASNDQVLAGASAERSRIKGDISKNLEILTEIKAAQEDISRKNKENTEQLKALDELKADIAEEKKSLNEKERLQKVLARQIDEKIATLNKLREEEKK